MRVAERPFTEKDTYFGLDELEWAEARGEVRGYLERARRDQATVTYEEVRMANQRPEVRRNRHALRALLYEIAAGDVAAGRPMLTALVVSKATRVPGAGFFLAARELYGEEVEPRNLFWLTELSRLYIERRS